MQNQIGHANSDTRPSYRYACYYSDRLAARDVLALQVLGRNETEEQDDQKRGLYSHSSESSPTPYISVILS
jgi:hypothetical protein